MQVPVCRTHMFTPRPRSHSGTARRRRRTMDAAGLPDATRAETARPASPAEAVLCTGNDLLCAVLCMLTGTPPATTRSTSNLWRVLLTGAGTHRLLAVHNESLASSDESRPRARAGKEALRVASTCRSFRAALAPSESGIWSTFYAQECVPGYRRGPHLASPRKKQGIRPQQRQGFLQRTAWSDGLNGRESSGPERGFFRLEQLPPRAGC